MRRPVLVLSLLIACGYPRPPDVGGDGGHPGDTQPRDGSGSGSADAGVSGGPLMSFAIDKLDGGYNNVSLPHDLPGDIQGTQVYLYGFELGSSEISDLAPTYQAAGTVYVDGSSTPEASDTAHDFNATHSYRVVPDDGGSDVTYTVQLIDRTLTASSASASALATNLAAADFDRDGRLDLVASFQVGGGIITYRNTAGSGASTVTLTSGSRIGTLAVPAIAVGDIDGDGAPDIVASVSGNLVIYLNTTGIGSGSSGLTFASSVSLGFPGGVQSIALADFDGDGILDIATIEIDPSAYSVALNSSSPGNVHFGNVVTTDVAVSTVSSLAAGDIDGSGNLDLAFTDGGNMAGVLINHTSMGGPPVFTLDGPYGTAFGNSTALAIADLNRDGRGDLAVATKASNDFSTLLAPAYSGSGVAANGGTTGVGATDLDGDHAPDLVITQQPAGGTAAAKVYINVMPAGSNTPAFLPHPAPGSATAAQAVCIGDFDGDQVADFAFATGSAIFVDIVTPAAQH